MKSKGVLILRTTSPAALYYTEYALFNPFNCECTIQHTKQKEDIKDGSYRKNFKRILY